MIWKGGGNKTQDVGDSNVSEKEEREFTNGFKVPSYHEPRPMGNIVLNENYLKLRKRKSHGSFDGSEDCNWIRD